MDPTVFLLVALAAVLHAVWNALVKVGGDQLMSITLVMGTGAAVALCATPFVSFPNPETWPYLLASTVVHLLYYGFLVLGYRHGDLSLVYPIARGVAPLLVAVGAFVAAGEQLSAQGVFAVSLISLGIVSLAMGGRRALHGPRSVTFALCTGICIAAYTVIDGLGARAAIRVENYIVWLFVIEPIPLIAISAAIRRGRVVATVRSEWRKGTIGGVLSMAAYGLVIWAMSITPMTYVSALRETSVIVATLIGVRLLREPMGQRRIWSTTIVAAGIVLLNYGR